MNDQFYWKGYVIMSKLEFGYAQADITPRTGLSLCGYFNSRPNVGFYDRLQIKAAVFRTGETCAALVSYDLCLFPRALVDKFDEKLRAIQSPLAGNVLYCATHTHTGPYASSLFTEQADEEYVNSLIEKTAAALTQAWKSLAPAELYTGTTECTTLAFNRRFIMKNGKTLTNPGKLNPEIDHTEGGVDHSILMAEVRQNDRPVLLITNISNHTDTIGGNVVSADWPGRMEAEIQYRLGYDLPVMTVIAPQGNINHFDVTSDVDQTSYAEANRIGKGYAGVILSALYRLKKVEDCTLAVASGEIDAPYYQLSDKEYAEAKRVYEENKDATMDAGRDFTSEDIARGVPFVKKYFAERAIGCRENPIPGKRIERQIALKFGTEFAVVSLPAEPFVEIGFAIREASRFPMTMLAALGQGEIGYVGLPGNYGNGGYETSPSRSLADPVAGLNMIEGAKKLLQ